MESECKAVLVWDGTTGRVHVTQPHPSGRGQALWNFALVRECSRRRATPPHNTTTMAPSYENLPLEDDEFDESQIDFTDIEEQFQVRLDEGLDAFVVIDGLPVVPEDSKGKLVKFVLRKLNSVGKVKEDGVHMPVGDDGKTEGYVCAAA